MQTVASLTELLELTLNLVLFAVLLASVGRWPGLGISVTLMVLLLQFDVPVLPALGRVFGFAVYFPDVMCAVSALLAVAQWREVVRNLGSIRWPLLGLTATVVVSVVHGSLLYGSSTAINESRLLVIPLSALWWACSLNWTGELSYHLFIVRPARVISIALIFIAVYHSLRYGVGGATSRFIVVDGVEQSSRVLTQMQAFVLSLSMLVIVHSAASRWQWSSRVLVTSACITIIVSQQRTVWVTTIVGLGIMIIWGERSARAAICRVLFGLTMAGGLALIYYSTSSLASLLEQSILSDDTYSARSEGWNVLLSSFLRGDILQIILGQPFGAGFARYDQNMRIITFSPHNFYLLSLLRVGVLGLACFVCVVVGALVRLKSIRTGVLQTCIISCVSVFCWTYGLSWVFAVFFGWALANPTCGRPIGTAPASGLARRGVSRSAT